MNNKKILSGLLLLSIVFSLFPTVTITKANSLDYIPAFPEDLVMPEKDWVELDWYSSSVLPEDKMNYEQEYDALIEEWKYNEAASLEMKKTLMYDEESYNFYKVPREVQEVVSDHMETLDENTLQSIDEKDLLKDKIRETLTNRNTSIQSISNSLPPQGRGAGGEGWLSQETEWRYSFPTEEKLPELTAWDFSPVDVQDLIEVAQTQWMSTVNVEMSEQEVLKNQTSLQSTLPSVMSYYDGIENDVMEYSVYSLAQQQNSDGSIWNTHKSRNTFAFLDMMKNIYRTNTLEYQKAQSYFVNLEPKNNLEKIYKISVLADRWEDYSFLKVQLDTGINLDNWVSLVDWFGSDLFTTLATARLYGNIWDTYNYTKVLNYLLPKIETDGSIKYDNLFSSSDKYLSYKMLQVLNLWTFENKQDYVDKLELFLENTEDITHTFDKALTSLYFEDKRDFKSVELYKNYLGYDQKNDGLFWDIITSIYTTQAIAKADIVWVDITTTGTVQHYSPVNITLWVKNIWYKPAYNIVFEKYVNTLQTGWDIQANIAALTPNITANINFALENTIKYKWDTTFDFFVKSDNDNSWKNNRVSKNITFTNSPENKARFPDYYIAYSHETSNGHGFNIRWNNDYIDNDLSKYIIMFRKKWETTWFVYDASPDKNGYFIPAGNIWDIYEVTLGVKSIQDPENIRHLPATDVIISDNDTPVISHISGDISIDWFTWESMKIYGYWVSHTTDFDGSFSADFKQWKNIIMIDDDRYESFKKYVHVWDNVDQYDFTLNTKLVPDNQAPTITNLKVNNWFQVRHNREVPIDISVTDNIDVKGIDLYYFDPNYNAWIYIDSVDIQYSQSEYLWNIDETYLWEWYKIKAIARDWSGNTSESLEYGPFNIISPLGPDGTIVVDVDTVKLWETINFSVNPWPSFDRYLKIELLYANEDRTILSTIDSSERNFTYTIPYSSKYIEQNAQISARICDVNNNCEDILSNPFSITDIDFSLPEKWQSQKDISFSMSNGDYNRWVYFIDKTDDTIEMVYDEFYKYTWKQEKIIYRKYQNGSWWPQVILKDFRNQDKDDNYLQYRNIKIRKQWEYLNFIGYTDNDIEVKSIWEERNMQEVIYMLIHNNKKVFEKQITSNNTMSTGLEINIDANGTWYIWWLDWYDAVVWWDNQIETFYLSTVSNTWVIWNIITVNDYKYRADIFHTGTDIVLWYRNWDYNYLFKYYDQQNNIWKESMLAFDGDKTSVKYIYSQDNYLYVFYMHQLTWWAEDLNVKKLSVSNNIISEIYDKTIYSADADEDIRKNVVKQNPQWVFHIVTKKEFKLDSRYVDDLRYIWFHNDTVKYNYSLAPLTTDFNSRVYLWLDWENVYIIFSSEISNIDKFRYFTWTFMQNTSNEFWFPEFNIDVQLSLDEFRIIFFFLGYKFSFWINLF